MRISSPAFKEGDKIPARYTGESTNLNPPLLIEEIPKEAEAGVLVCEDPDAETSSGKPWLHWSLFNVPCHNGDKIEITENSYLGIKGLNDFGKLQYGGPMPPRGSGKHRYVFKFYALDKNLDLKEGAKREEVEKAMSKIKILDKAEFFGIYWRD